MVPVVQKVACCCVLLMPVWCSAPGAVGSGVTPPAAAAESSWPPRASLLQLRLRGGGALSAFDQQLQDEILNDIRRDERGEQPLFVEQLGQEEQSGAFKYGVGVEAAMPAVIGEAPDATMADDETGAQAYAHGEGATDGAGRNLEAEELAEAKRWFAEKDKVFFHHSEMTEEFILGHTGIPQRRELMPGEPLETYLELRKDCTDLGRFMRTLPHNITLMRQALDDYGWHDGILRNGTRIRWTPDTRVIDMESFSEVDSEFEEKDDGWFRDTLLRVARDAFALPSPASVDFGHYYRQHNSTFNDLATMRTLLNDTFILACNEELQAEAGDDEHRLRACSELWALFDVKWEEFLTDRRFPDACAAAYREVEEGTIDRLSKLHQSYDIDRQIEYADPESDEVTTPWGLEA